VANSRLTSHATSASLDEADVAFSMTMQPAEVLTFGLCNLQGCGVQVGPIAWPKLARQMQRTFHREEGQNSPMMDRRLVVAGAPEEPVRTRSSIENLPWLIGGVAFLALLLGVILHFRQEAGPAQQLAAKANRIDVVTRMQLGLASASEAEKSSVLAVTDKDSQASADQARAATAGVEQGSQEIATLLAASGTQREKELLAHFLETFRNLKVIDEEVLTLAVKNTNLKAYSLLFGEAANTLAEMDGALSRVIARHADSPVAKRVMLMAFGARIGVLRIQVLLAPHIAEESDPKMDQMEALMSEQETQVRKDLDGLTALANFRGDDNLRTAVSRFVRYEEVKARILALSRENTNVRSLTLSLSQKRNALALCLDALNALKVALLFETRLPPTVQGGDITRGRWLRSMA
jgi:uncharacterized membrane protein